MSRDLFLRSVSNVEVDDDAMLIEAADTVERQLAHQEQLGGSLSASEPGRFEFTLYPYVDRRSYAMGARVRHYLTNVRSGIFFAPTTFGSSSSRRFAPSLAKPDPSRTDRRTRSRVLQFGQ